MNSEFDLNIPTNTRRILTSIYKNVGNILIRNLRTVRKYAISQFTLVARDIKDKNQQMNKNLNNEHEDMKTVTESAKSGWHVK